MKLIGLTGKAGVGKDTVADYLCSRHDFIKYSLAEPIKRMLDVIGVDCRTRETKEVPHPVFGVSPRRMAQTLGTEWMRDLIHPYGWLKCAEQFIKSPVYAKIGVNGIVIPDIRFENEAEWLRAQGGELWHITRGGIPAVEAHSSESGVAILATDVVLHNNWGISFLHEAVDELMGMEGV